MSNFRSALEKWKSANNMNGPMAMPRFVMFQFLERLSETSDEFVFKGGNLLWFYIKTPRPTIDLDFVTKAQTDANIVVELLTKACENTDLDLHFSIFDNYEIKEDEGQVGLAVSVGYKVPSLTVENKFKIDIVLGVQTDIKQIQLNRSLLNVASMENIICDKFMACRDFGSGNTRAKDFDDLLRICENIDQVDLITLKKLSALRHIPLELDYRWISSITMDAWERHLGKYRQTNLPRDLEEVFEVINQTFNQIKSIP